MNKFYAKATLKAIFYIRLADLRDDLLKVRITFEKYDPPKSSAEGSAEGSGQGSAQGSEQLKLGLSWIIRENRAQMKINKTFWDRAKKTKDEKEKHIICYTIAMCIFHEVAHVAVQLSLK